MRFESSLVTNIIQVWARVWCCNSTEKHTSIPETGVKWLARAKFESTLLANAGSIPATSTMEINKYIKTEIAKLDRGIVATPSDRERLELFVKANNGVNDFLIMQMSINYGYKLALENLQIEHEQESII